MRAQFINEKFVEGGDPIKQMGIGAFTKKFIQREIKKLAGTVDEDTIGDFISEYANDEVGGGFDVYLAPDSMEELYWLCKLLGKKRIKVIGFTPDDEKVPERYSYDWRDTLEYTYNKKVQPWINKGWEEWNSEDNDGYWEYILLKYDK
jgi:hypothetical protein